MSNLPPSAADSSAAPNAPRTRRIGTKLKIAGFIVGVVAVEWVVAALYLPSAAPGAPRTGQLLGRVPGRTCPGGNRARVARTGADTASHGGGKAVGHGTQQEVDLGEFTVTAYQPVSSSTLFISFHLYASVLDKHGEELGRRLEEHKHQVRDNIIVIIRSAEITDLTDAGLGLIKRRILETTNRTLGKPLLQGIMFSDFSFVEQ